MNLKQDPPHATGSGPIVRKAMPADVPAMWAMEAAYIVQGVENWRYDPLTEGDFARRLERLTDAGYPVLVAGDPSAGALLGYAYAGPFHEQAAWRHTVEHSIYVAPSAHRRGIGRALLSRLIDVCTARHFRQMIAGISDPGAEASIAFHEAMGFTHVGRFPDVGWKKGRWLSVVYMQRTLGEGASAPPVP
jgi:phosphinothricin acetyltransferase